jgi:PAS domain S-box-containing protein
LRLRPIAAVALVLGLTVAGFIVARVLAERDARHESERRVAIASTQIESRLEEATSLTESLSQFMLDDSAAGVTNDQFTKNALRWLSPAGFPAAAWAEEVQAAGRPAYERRVGRPIVAPDERRRSEPAGSSYLPASLISGFPPMNMRGIDLSREPGVVAALGRAIRPGGVGATPIAARSDGTRGVFLVAPAPNLIDGVLRPGAVVVFLSEATLGAAARNPAGLTFPPADRASEGRAGGDTVREEFAVAGQQFAVVMPKQSVSGPGAILPWIILSGGLLLAALAAALGVIAMRRARAQQDFDRIFNLSPDLVAVADFDGHFTRVNPAAEQILGYTERELLGRRYLDFVHPDDRERTASEAAAISRGNTTLSFENRLVRKDGTLRAFEWTATPVVEDAVMYGMARDVTERRRAETESERLAAEQSALRRVAELVAQQAPPEQVFTLVTDELSNLLDVNLVWTARFEPDGSATVLATRGRAADRMPPGTNIPLLAGGVFDQVLRTGRPARLDDYAHIHGLNDRALIKQLREDGLRCGAGGPIVVEGRVWGAMLTASPTTESLPPGIEDRIAQFAELVSTAISNVESRARVERLAAEQSALRRVAELVARQVPPEKVFALVNRELSHLLGVDMVRTVRFEADGSATVVAASGMADDPLPPGTNVPIPSGTVIDKVSRTSRPARVDDYAKTVGGPLAARLGKQGAGSAAGGPIVVDGRLWGAMVACKAAESLPPDTEERVAQFAELVSTAISNVESRAEVERLAAEQAALRRVATLVAREPASDRLFSTVSREVASVLNVPGVIIQRYEADGTVVTVGQAFDSDLAGVERFFAVGSRMSRDPGSLAAPVFETQRPARIDDFSTLPGTIRDLARAAGLGSGCAGPIVVNDALWGKMCVFSGVGTVLPLGTENRLHEFIELIATAIANYEAHADLEASEKRARELAEEQAALRRVATLVAEGATPNRVFDAVRDEVEQMFGIPNTILMRFDPDGMATLLATPGDYLGRVGKQWPLEGDDSAVTRVYRTGRAARADYTAGAVGPLAEAARSGGTLFPVAVPVVVDGALWGAMSVGSRGPQPPPPDLEGRLTKFTELLATAVANAESRADLAASEARARELANEQAALRRVATLVAQGSSPDELFSAVAREAAAVVDIPVVSVQRYEADGTLTILGNTGATSDWIGTRWPVKDDALAGMILATGRPSRWDDFTVLEGPLGDPVREALRDSWQEVRSVVGVPILVEGKIWGFMSAAAEPGGTLIPAGTEERLARFTELVATAVSNATTRTELLTSRARVVSAADETRRRLERDLHDGIQQRLIALALRARKAAGLASAGESVVQELSRLGDDLVGAIDELREISRGIHPAILSDAGLDEALTALARRSTIPVDVDVAFQGRYEPTLEATVYYVVAESITNAVKHAQASTVSVRGRQRDGALELEITDDGVGGVDPSRGTGLIGLRDRVDTLGGAISFAGPAGAGTTVHVTLPARSRDEEDPTITWSDEAASTPASS